MPGPGHCSGLFCFQTSAVQIFGPKWECHHGGRLTPCQQLFPDADLTPDESQSDGAIFEAEGGANATDLPLALVDGAAVQRLGPTPAQPPQLAVGMTPKVKSGHGLLP